MEFTNNEIEIKAYRKHWFDLLFSIALIFVFYIGIYFILRWFVDRIVVTNQAVYVRTGLIMRDEKRLPLRNIQDVSFNQRFFGRIFGFGTVWLTLPTAKAGGILASKRTAPKVASYTLSTSLNSRVPHGTFYSSS